jgi:uncharacterized membrane protein YdbT with pleckstrin-like domain
MKRTDGSEAPLERRQSGRAMLGSWLVGGGLTLLLVLAAFFFPFLFLPLFLAAPFPLLVAWLRARLTRAGATYRLYPDRLEIERGLLGRRVENLELFRIRDLGIRQGLLGRLLNYGEVSIHSTDASAPDVVLANIDQPRAFYQALRDRVTESRAHRQTLIVEEGRPLLPPERE